MLIISYIFAVSITLKPFIMYDKLSGKELAEAFSDAVNSSNFKVDEFVETFTRQHRTLQQSMFGAMLAVVSKVGSDDYRTDARNEQSKSTAKKLLDGYEEESYKELIAQGDSEVSARKYAKLFRERLNSLSFI